MGIESYNQVEMRDGDMWRVSGRGVLGSGATVVWGRSARCTHSAVSADAVVAFKHVPSKGPFPAATQWETRPTTLCSRRVRKPAADGRLHAKNDT